MSTLGKQIFFFIKYLVVLFFATLSFNISAQEHPSLILTKKGVSDIRAQLGNVPIFDKTLAKVKKEVDIEIESGIHVPIPKDMAGGYTHDRHKKKLVYFTESRSALSNFG